MKLILSFTALVMNEALVSFTLMGVVMPIFWSASLIDSI